MRISERLITLACGSTMVCAVATSFGVTVTVAPSSGPITTISGAISLVNAGPDASNTIILRSTEGPHILPADADWVFDPGKSVDFMAESGQPIIVAQPDGNNYQITVTVDASSTMTMNAIAVIPSTGQLDTNAVGKGVMILDSGNYHFTNCVFSANDGSNGVASQEGAITFASLSHKASNNWFVLGWGVNATWSHCTITGCWDNAIFSKTLFSGAGNNLTFDNGTCIANVGDNGISTESHDTRLVLDGSGGRVQIAKCGQSGIGAGNAIHCFWDIGCSINATKVDIIANNAGGIFDNEGIHDGISITDSRIAFNDADNTGHGNLYIDDLPNDDGIRTEDVSFTRSTVHNSGAANSTFWADNAGDPRPDVTIIDSIFSGSGDNFDLSNPNHSGPVSNTFSSVVTAGPDAVAAAGDLGAGAVSADPMYTSYAYTIGRSQANPSFLRPSNAVAYTGVASGGANLVGGAGGTAVPVQVSGFVLE